MVFSAKAWSRSTMQFSFFPVDGERWPFSRLRKHERYVRVELAGVWIQWGWLKLSVCADMIQCLRNVDVIFFPLFCVLLLPEKLAFFCLVVFCFFLFREWPTNMNVKQLKVVYFLIQITSIVHSLHSIQLLKERCSLAKFTLAHLCKG